MYSVQYMWTVCLYTLSVLHVDIVPLCILCLACGLRASKHTISLHGDYVPRCTLCMTVDCASLYSLVSYAGCVP